VLMGVNPQDLALSRVSSNGSCTTNSAASVIDVPREHIGVRKAILNTVHGYTATHMVVDTSDRGPEGCAFSELIPDRELHLPRRRVNVGQNRRALPE
jgi:glyceraldehyde-3-phosphate dehydrogenase/erythrose-4-phosphate dehydrogenase